MNNCQSLAGNPPEEVERNSLRGQIESTDAQIEQLEYEIAQITEKLEPVLLPAAPAVQGVEAVSAKQMRSPAADRVYQQGARIYDAHQRLCALKARLSL